MSLTPNWRELLLKAWSMKFWTLSVILGMFEMAVPYLDGKISPHTFTVLAALAGLAGMVARLIQQFNLDKPDAQ